MLRGVVALAAVGVFVGSPALAVDLITYPTLARGTLTFAPAPFATLNIDWLEAFAVDPDSAKRLAFTQPGDVLSGLPVAGYTTALFELADPTRIQDPPQADQQRSDKLAPFDFQ
jgi:hypothetical protein